MDYLDHALVIRDASWAAFREATRGRRLILASTKAEIAYTDFSFGESDILLMGRESAGVPEEVHTAADARLLIPLRPGLRSLNVALACAMLYVWEFLLTRQAPLEAVTPEEAREYRRNWVMTAVATIVATVAVVFAATRI